MSKAALKNKKKREAKARRQQEQPDQPQVSSSSSSSFSFTRNGMFLYGQLLQRRCFDCPYSSKFMVYARWNWFVSPLMVYFCWVVLMIFVQSILKPVYCSLFYYFVR